MTADLKNEAQKALDAYDKYESHRDALQFAAAIESLRKAVELQAPAEAHSDVLVPLTLLEDASSALGNFVSDHGWTDEDMQVMDNLDAFIARHKANARANVQPKHTAEPVAWIRWEWNRSGGKSLEFFKPDELSLSDQARGVVYDPLYAQAPAPAQSAAYLTGDGKLHVTAWECHGCGHRGINDGDDASEACSDCDWRGPCPDEDVCPGCGREGTMVSACPKCGDRYYIKAEADIVIPTAAQAPAVKDGPALTYSSTQATKCASCGEHKHTPLRIDAMGGYVCLTCIDKKLGGLLGEFGYEDDPQRRDAERYRFIRDADRSDPAIDFTMLMSLAMDSMDAAIDEAMSREAGESDVPVQPMGGE